MTALAPIILFVYNRLDETKKTIEALQKNYLAPQSELYIFSDGTKTELGKEKIASVRNYVNTVKGFKKVTVIAAKQNNGLAKSIITGVTDIVNTYEKAIIVEDDLVTSPNFLDYMNQALTFYKDHDKIISISGYTLNLPNLKNSYKDYYLGLRASSWGWGTWKQKWNAVDWELKDYQSFINDKQRVADFARIGSDMPKMLKYQMEGKIDSWAIRFCYYQFKQKMYCVFPTVSKLKSIGFTNEATHTAGSTRFDTTLDKGTQRDFTFDHNLIVDEKLLKDFRDKFSIKSRLIDKVKQLINR
ncbi:glycosyltransferase [Aquimarina agarivorans]|uniref:glycosyltransferase n=1 Tax=Aquimarina agarivorans TaxID=980584 RepID=UPI000248E851|nr:glycosyltransferase [Aquimarina agarivorans]